MGIADILKGFKDKVDLLKEEVAKLKAKNLHLIEENTGLHAELDMLKAADEFVMYQGLAFKKNASGGVDTQPRCPKCHDLLSTKDNTVFFCKPCDYTTSVWEHPEDIAKKLMQLKIS